MEEKHHRKGPSHEEHGATEKGKSRGSVRVDRLKKPNLRPQNGKGGNPKRKEQRKKIFD